MHAFIADKRNLILLSDPPSLRAWGLSEAEAGYLKNAVPKTRLVSASDEAALWSNRRKLFFKKCISGHAPESSDPVHGSAARLCLQPSLGAANGSLRNAFNRPATITTITSENGKAASMTAS